MPHRAIRAGTWRPAALTQSDLTQIVALITIGALVRGLDYWIPPTTVGIVERAAPMWAWSVSLWTGALALIIGARQKRHLLVWLGHGILATLYAGIAVSVLVDSTLKLDGWRGAIPIAAISFLHWKFWLRTGPRPIDQPTHAEGAVMSEGAGDA